MLVTIGRETAESRAQHPTDEQYLEEVLVFEAMSVERADHLLRLLRKYATKLGMRTRAGAVHAYRAGPES